jgi:hypothetical protein
MAIDVDAGAQALGVSPASLGLPILPPTAAPQQLVQPPMAAPGQGAAPQPADIGQNAPPAAPYQPTTGFGKLLADSLRGSALDPATRQAAATQPMGWAKTLVGSAMNAASGIASSLGDVAHANDNFRPGQGGLSGIANVMAARNQRMAQQTEQQSKLETDKALRAETVARTMRTYYDMKTADQGAKNSLASSNAAVYKANEADFDTQNGLTQDQINQYEKDNPQWFDTKKIDITGYVPATDSKNNPIIDPKSGAQQYIPRFSIQSLKPKDGVSTSYKLTDDQIDLINRSGLTSAPITKPGPNDPPVKMPIDQFNALWSKVKPWYDADKIGQAANGEALTAEHQKEVNALIQSDHDVAAVYYDPSGFPVIGINKKLGYLDQHINGVPEQGIPSAQAQINARMAKNPNDPQIPQLQQTLKDMTDLRDKLTRLDQIGIDDKQRQDAMTYLDKQAKEVEQKRKDDAEIRQKNSAAALDDAKAENERNQKQGMDDLNVAMSNRTTQQIDALAPDLKAVVQGAPKNQQATLMSVAFGDGDVDMKAFPKSVRKGVNQLTESQAQDIITQLNPNWTPQMYDIKHAAYKDATTGKLNDQAGSLNNFIGHAAEARDIANQFYNNDPKIFKTVLNSIDKATWGTQVVALQQAMDVVNGEFQNMVLSGHVPSSDEKAAQATLVNANSTVGQINAALNVMGHMGATRANTMNEQYRTKTGTNFPNLIYPANVDDARKLGIPVERYNSGGRIGVSNQPGQPAANAGAAGKPPAPGPNTHVFDPAAWQQTHPGQDVSVATKYAQSQGYQIKQPTQQPQ